MSGAQIAVRKALFEVPSGAAARCRDGCTIIAAIVGDRIAFGAEHDRGRKTGKVCIVQGTCGGIICRWDRVFMTDTCVKEHIVARQHGRVCMCEVAALIWIAAKAGVDQHLAQHLAQRRNGGVAQCMCDRSREAGTCGITCQKAIPGCGNGAGHGQRIEVGGGVFVFGGQTVIDADDCQTGMGTDFCANVIVAVQIAHDETAAVQVNDGWLRAGVDAAGDACDGLIMRGDAGRIAAVERPAHGIIDAALVGDASIGGIFRKAGVRARNEGPGRGVDKGLIICRCHDACEMGCVP